MRKLLTALLLLVCLPLAALADDVPYRQRVTSPDEPIFTGPGYDEGYVRTVEEAGVYTIVEEHWDDEGNLWGRLKSGAGWLDLTHVRSPEAAALPVTASLAENALPAAEYHTYIIEDSEYTSWLIFHAREMLTDIRLVSLELTEEGFAIGETLHALPELPPEQPLLAGVVFHGDMTTYGLRFTDDAGQQRLFAAYISGRNGMLVLEEWAVVSGTEGTESVLHPG